MVEEGSRSARQWLPLLAVIAAVLLLQASYGLCAQDDAFISFRYALNLVEGRGLVFNPSERVEGYTNFLWTMIFVPVLGAGLDPTPVATSLGMLCTAALLWSSWELSGRRWLVPLLVASFPGLGLEGVQGLETCFYAFLVCQALRDGPAWSTYAGLAALTRPEGYAVFGLLWLWRRRPRDLFIFACFVVPHLVFRLGYYGGLVPNTFHAKVGGLPYLRGLAYLGDLALMQLPFLCVVPVAIGLLARERGLRLRDEPSLGECATLALFFCAYIVGVGGDFKGTGRFLIPVLAPMAVLVQAALPRPWAPYLAVGALLAAIPGLREMDHFAGRFREELVRRRAIGEFLAEVVAPDRWIAVHAAGVLPYYAGLPTIDMWGLNDAHIARAEVQGMGEGVAGHERRDYGYVLSREPWLILPEQHLLTPVSVDLGDPGVFGPDFLLLYEPLSLQLPGGEGVLNFWRRRTVVRVVEPPAESPEEAPLEDEGEPAEDGGAPP